MTDITAKRTKILAVGMLPPPIGGQALMFQRAIIGLRKYYDITVIDTQFQNNLGESGKFSIRKSLRFFTLLFGKIIPVAFKCKHDILYYCLSGPSIFGLCKDLVFLIPLRARARKVVYHLHGAGGVTLLMQGNAFLRTWARLVLFEPDLILRPASDSDEADLCRAKRDIIVNNCVEDPIGGVPKSAQKWPNGNLVFTFIGLLTEDKGIFDLIEIAHVLRERGYQFTLFVVGEGLAEEVGRLNKLILHYNLSDYVHLTSVLVGQQKFELLHKTTIFLFPSYFRAETQPTVLMEALAVGVPVVAYDWRGIKTIVDQGVNGFIAPVRDIKAFCNAVEKILTDCNIEEMQIAARRIFLDRFTLDSHLVALRRAFQSLEVES